MQKTTPSPTVREPSRAEPASVKVESGARSARSFVVPGAPVAKPRQTRSDKWKQRPCVLRYRAWADRARDIAGTVSVKTGRLDVVAYFPIPKHFCGAVRESMIGDVHLSKPDADNVLKAVSDALCPHDQIIHDMSIKKRWDDGKGPRVEITIY